MTSSNVYGLRGKGLEWITGPRGVSTVETAQRTKARLYRQAVHGILQARMGSRITAMEHNKIPNSAAL